MRVRFRLLSITAALALVGCSPSVEENKSSPAVTVWSQQTGQQGVWREILGTFERSHPGIKVNFRAIPHNQYDAVLRTAMQGEGGPDIPFLRSYGGIQAFVEGQNLEPLDDKVTEMMAWDKTALDGARGDKDSKIYGVPYAIQTTQFFYNKKIFRKYGLRPPTTWDQFVNIYNTLTKNRVTAISASYKDASMLSHYFADISATQYGGATFEQKLLRGETTYNDPQYIKAIKFFDAFVQAYFPKEAAGMNPPDAQTVFQAGKAAMHPAGTWEIQQYNETPGLEVGLFSMPPGPGAIVDETLTPGYVDGSFGLNAKSKNKESALQLLRWFTTKEFGTQVMDKLVQPSLVPDVEAQDPLLAAALANYHAHPTPYISYADFSGGSPGGESLEQDNLQKVLLRQQSAEEAASNIAHGIGQWFKPKR